MKLVKEKWQVKPVIQAFEKQYSSLQIILKELKFLRKLS